MPLPPCQRTSQTSLKSFHGEHKEQSLRSVRITQQLDDDGRDALTLLAHQRKDDTARRRTADREGGPEGGERDLPKRWTAWRLLPGKGEWKYAGWYIKLITSSAHSPDLNHKI